MKIKSLRVDYRKAFENAIDNLNMANWENKLLTLRQVLEYGFDKLDIYPYKVSSEKDLPCEELDRLVEYICHSKDIDGSDIIWLAFAD